MNTATRRALVATLLLSAAAAQAADPVEGKDYFRINPAAPTSDATKIVVTEYFSYQCPHCFTFAKPFAAWSAGVAKDVKADRAAVSIGHATWAAAGTGVLRLDGAEGRAGHRRRLLRRDPPRAQEARRRSIASPPGWPDRASIARAFEKAYRSFSVQLQTKRAEDQSRKVRLPSVPVARRRRPVSRADRGRRRLPRPARTRGRAHRARAPREGAGKAASP